MAGCVLEGLFQEQAPHLNITQHRGQSMKLYKKEAALGSRAADSANDAEHLADIPTKDWQIGGLGSVMSFGECTAMSMSDYKVHALGNQSLKG